MNATKAELKRQYERAKKAGWIPMFEKACAKHKIAVALGLAIASRETNMKNIKGDFRGGKYHGYGVMQVDIGTDSRFASTWSEKNAEPAIVRGIEILAAKRDQLIKIAGKSFSLIDSKTKKKSTAVAPSLKGDQFLKVWVGMYNGGLWPLYHLTKGRDSDRGTTGYDYAADVLARMDVFEDLLEADGFESGVPEQPASKQNLSIVKASNDAVQTIEVVDPDGEAEDVQSGEVKAGEAAPTDTAKKDEAIVGGRPVDPPVVIHPVEPSMVEATVTKIKAWHTIVVGHLGAMFTWIGARFAGASEQEKKFMLIGVTASAITMALIVTYLKNQREQRTKDEREKDKQRAHEREMAQLHLRADPTKYNVVIGTDKEAA